MARWRLAWQVTPICVTPQALARFLRIAVLLAQMDPIGAEPLGQADRIVDDERHVAVGADALERFGQPRGGMIVHVLDAKLERGDRPGVQRADQPFGKGARDIERGDEIQFAGGLRHRRALPPLRGGGNHKVNLRNARPARPARHRKRRDHQA
jgi:hypothetical protein